MLVGRGAAQLGQVNSAICLGGAGDKAASGAKFTDCGCGAGSVDLSDCSGAEFSFSSALRGSGTGTGIPGGADGADCDVAFGWVELARAEAKSGAVE